MSAFVVEDKTINKIVAYLYRDPMERSTRRRKLAFDLFTMNCRAVDTRYPDKHAQSSGGFYPDDFGFKEVEPPSAVAFVKMAQCLRYQCAEGKIPEEPLFKALSDSINIACVNIVESLPEYEQCPWG